MAETVITCITCPIGCEITVESQGTEILGMKGNQCKRGEEYARNEFCHPVRILTTTVLVEGGEAPLVPVRSAQPLPKDRLLDCMEAIKKIAIPAPVSCYDVVIPNLLGTGVDLVATGTVEAQGS